MNKTAETDAAEKDVANTNTVRSLPGVICYYYSSYKYMKKKNHKLNLKPKGKVEHF